MESARVNTKQTGFVAADNSNIVSMSGVAVVFLLFTKIRRVVINTK